jgi:hypothetical protein
MQSMRNLVKSSNRWLRASWFLPLVALALPNCAFQTGGIAGPPPAFDPGPQPETSAIMCDIPKVPAPGSGACANSTEVGLGMSLEHAAVALAQGEQSSIALDLSPAAETACGGFPQKIEFQGPFPDGYAVCLNCAAQIPAHYADANAACVAQCIDLVNHGGGQEPPGGADAFCQANAHVSTNFDKNSCYDDACSGGGTLRSDFVDPRRAQEPVKWIDLVGASVTGNALSRTLATDGLSDAGGASAQTIAHGDGWVEFEAGENDKGHVLGLSPDVGTDADPSPTDIAFGIRLSKVGKVAIVEGDTQVGAAMGTYSPGDRFRIQVKDNLDGTASVSYVQLIGPCTPGTVCSGSVIATSANSAKYPLRVDASLGQEGATLTNVTLVRIQ